MAEAKLGNLDIQYDSSADVLYCSFGHRKKQLAREMIQACVPRNPETSAIVGITA